MAYLDKKIKAPLMEALEMTMNKDIIAEIPYWNILFLCHPCCIP